ncbi:MAG: hypothetical protein AAGJ97_04115, partial [Planctomycetota bacterium]
MFAVLALVFQSRLPVKRSVVVRTLRGDSPSDPPGLWRQATFRRQRRRPASAPTSFLGLRTRQTVLSVGRVVLPAVLALALGVSYYDNLSTFINERFLDTGSIQFLSSDDIQFIPSFLEVLSLLFSILAGSAYSSLYAQQEDIYFALYREVSDAKSLLEQLALVCAGRPFYIDALRYLQIYIKTD